MVNENVGKYTSHMDPIGYNMMNLMVLRKKEKTEIFIRTKMLETCDGGGNLE